MTGSNLLHNVLALSSVQILSYFLPLITLPYVTRTLGVESWGTLALVQAVLSYFMLVTNWGFSLSGTGKVAMYRCDIKNLSQVFISTWAGQWVLCLLSCISLIFLVNFVPFFEKNSIYFIWGVGVIVGNVLFPVWFLNGLEKMKELAAIQILSKVVNVPLIFIFINSQSDAPLIIAIAGLTSVFSGILSIAWIMRRLSLKWELPLIENVYRELKEGGVLFASTFWVSLYTTITPILLGSISGAAAVGYYTFADRFRALAQSVLSPITQALYPRLSHLYINNFDQAYNLLFKSTKIIIGASFIFSLGLWVTAPYIIILIGGEQFRPAIEVLRWLSPLPLIIALSNILGVQVMLANRKNAEVNRVLGVAGVVSLGIMFPLIYIFGATGASLSTLIIELFVTCGFTYYVYKLKFFKNDFLARR